MSPVILETAAKVSIVIAAGAAAHLALRRASAASRHMIWISTVIALLALPVLSLTVPSWTIAIRTTASTIARTPDLKVGPTTDRESVAGRERATDRESVAGRESATDRGSVAGREGIPVGPTFRSGVLAVATSSPSSPSAPSSLPSSSDWMDIAVPVYFFGLILLLTRLAVSQWRVRVLCRRSALVVDPSWTHLLRECQRSLGMHRAVRLLRSVDQTMPMTCGTMRPAVVIPSVADTWTEDRRRAVLLHELAHVDRQDCLTQLLAAVACAIYWVHPGAWWVARRLRIERELACDDRVLIIGTSSRDYAGHLLDLAYTLGGSRALALSVSMARPRQIEGRMLAVLDEARNRAIPARRTRLISVAVAIACVVPVAAAQTIVVPTVSRVGRENPAMFQKGAAVTRPEPRLPGTWEVRQSSDAKTVNLQLHERPNSSNGFTVAIGQLEGLSPAVLAGNSGTVTFNLRRDAGTLTFEGVFRGGVGAGTYNFTPSPTFPAEMTKRGFAKPTAADQYRLAVGDVGFAYLDELNAQKYAKPDLAQLVSAGEHGADLNFLRGMGQAGYRLGQIEALITDRDHGVTPDYVRDMGALGLTKLSNDDLVRARDHGVEPTYIGEMKALGYAPLSLEALIEARDHGVEPVYIRGMSDLGYGKQTLKDLIGARDHGVEPTYVQSLRQLGYRLSMTELINARDHGVDAEQIKGMNAIGYQNVLLDELIRLRDHGVDAKYAREQNDRARSRLSIDQLISRRDRGGE